MVWQAIKNSENSFIKNMQVFINSLMERPFTLLLAKF